MQNASFEPAADATILSTFNNTKSVTADESKHYLPNRINWTRTPNMQNESISKCDETLPRIQPSCFHSVDISQQSIPHCLVSNISKQNSSTSPPNVEKRISFDLKYPICNDKVHELSNTDAMESENGKEHRVNHLLAQMEILEEKIQKAAFLEHRSHQSLDKVTQKRLRWEEQHHEAISRRPRANDEIASTVLERYISEAETKITKAMTIEKAYKRKVKELHDKRYRWSKLYESAGRDLLELDPSRVIRPLPPLSAPSFIRR